MSAYKYQPITVDLSEFGELSLKELLPFGVELDPEVVDSQQWLRTD